jgi:hypothetical protein
VEEVKSDGNGQKKKTVSFSAKKVSFVYSPVILGLAPASDWSIAPCDTFGAHLGLALFSTSLSHHANVHLFAD